jgi:hypothetical protein
MADLSKFKKCLGAPPPIEDTGANLKAPEIAPSPPAAATTATQPKERDGRSARRTGRTVQFATRVSDEFDERFRTVCKRDSLLMVELLEKALDAYEGRR